MLSARWHFLRPAFRRYKPESSSRLHFVSANHRVDNNGCADYRQWNKSETNFRARKVLSRDSANLRANRRAGVHDQCNQNVYIPFHGMAKCTIAGGNDDFEKVSADCEVRRNSKDVDHRRHPNVAGSATEKAAEYSADERH